MWQSLERAKKLRKNMTNAERRMWYYLRDRRFNGFKFKRQVPIGEYIVDFLCYNNKLIIELDGGHHSFENELLYDKKRTEYFISNGYRVLRYWNREIFCEIDSVLNDIYNHLLM